MPVVINELEVTVESQPADAPPGQAASQVPVPAVSPRDMVYTIRMQLDRRLRVFAN